MSFALQVEGHLLDVDPVATQVGEVREPRRLREPGDEPDIGLVRVSGTEQRIGV